LVPAILDFLISFSAVLWEALPFIVLGAVVAGILEEFLPQEFITRILPTSVIPAVMIGGVLGLIFPMCECGIVVVMRRLLRKGLPLSSCIAYMLAGPIINLVVIFSTWVAFRDHKIGDRSIGYEMVGLRVGLAFVIACVTGFVVHLQARRYGTAALLNPLALPPATPAPAAQQVNGADPNGPGTITPPKPSFFQRLGNISSTALHDFVDITVFLILGAVLAALARQYITAEQTETLSRDYPQLAIPAMMMLGFLMCLCSEADAFVAASFTKMHVTAKLSFLVLGPMLDIKLVLMYTRVFRLRLIATIIACVVIQTLALCLIVHEVYKWNGWQGLPPS
jgi:uncharacterized membrane protein YraQ (UPF0718 family)